MPSRFVPNSFEVTQHMRDHVILRHDITDEEVDRQIYEWRLHEYRRAYSDWTRAFYRWFDRANDFGTLRRERKLRQPEEPTEEQRILDLEKYRRDMKEKYGVEVK